VLCLFRHVQASNDASLLCHELFSLYVHIPRRCSSSSLSSYYSVSHEFLSLPFCLLRLYAEGIHFSTHDLTNVSVFVGWCSSSFCFHPPCPKPLDWIGVQTNWFSLTFSKSTAYIQPICKPRQRQRNKLSRIITHITRFWPDLQRTSRVKDRARSYDASAVDTRHRDNGTDIACRGIKKRQNLGWLQKNEATLFNSSYP